MILAPEDRIAEYTRQGWWGARTLLDDFDDAVQAHPQREALADAPNRAAVTDGQPRQLTWGALAHEVARMAAVPGGVDRLFSRRPLSEGVRITVRDDTVLADVHLVVTPGSNMRDVGQRVQREVAQAIEQMVGMDVAAVHVHIRDVAFGDAGSE